MITSAFSFILLYTHTHTQIMVFSMHYNSVSTSAHLCLHAQSTRLSVSTVSSVSNSCKELMSGFFSPSVLMEGSYSQTGPVNVCYCLRKAKWLLYISLRPHLNVPSADEMKEGVEDTEERQEKWRNKWWSGRWKERHRDWSSGGRRSKLKHTN